MAKNKKKNLKINVSNLYILAAFVFILGFGFFGTSKFFFAEDIPVNQTELHQDLDLKANGKFTINGWTYDKEKELMEITLVTNGIQDYTTHLDFTAVSRENLSAELPTEIVYSESDIYVIRIEEVPDDFNQMALRLNKDEKDYEELFADQLPEKEQGNILTTIYTDQRVVEAEQILEKNFTEYAIEITAGLIVEAENEIKKAEDELVGMDEIIGEIQDEIERLGMDLLYQTVEEQVETNNEIFKLQEDIEDYEGEKKILTENIQNIRHKIERLKQKQYDLNI